MCDDPECGKCNDETRNRIMNAGLELGDKMLAVLDRHLKGLDPEDRNDVYFFVSSGEIALVKAAVALIRSIPNEGGQNLTLDNLVRNLTTMVRAMQGKENQAPDNADHRMATLH